MHLALQDRQSPSTNYSSCTSPFSWHKHSINLSLFQNLAPLHLFNGSKKEELFIFQKNRPHGSWWLSTPQHAGSLVQNSSSMSIQKTHSSASQAHWPASAWLHATEMDTRAIHCSHTPYWRSKQKQQAPSACQLWHRESIWQSRPHSHHSSIQSIWHPRNHCTSMTPIHNGRLCKS